MSEQFKQLPAFTDQWLLRNLPVVSYFSADDDRLTLSFLEGTDGKAFGFDVTREAGRRGLITGQTIVQQDDAVLAEHVNQAVIGHSPVVSRMRTVDAEGEQVPFLMVSQGVFSERETLLGISGIALDLRPFPKLLGGVEVLSQGGHRNLWPQKTSSSDQPTSDWLAPLLPVVSYGLENDASFTVRYLRGPIRRMLGYSAEDLVDNQKYQSWSTVPPEDMDVVERHVESVINGEGRPVASRYRAVNLHGKEIPLLVIGRSVDHPQREGRMLCSVAFSIEHVRGLQGPSELLT